MLGLTSSKTRRLKSCVHLSKDAWSRSLITTLFPLDFSGLVFTFLAPVRPNRMSACLISYVQVRWKQVPIKNSPTRHRPQIDVNTGCITGEIHHHFIAR